MPTNVIDTLTFITQDMLRQTKNNLQFLGNVSGQNFASMFTNSPKKGDTFDIRKTTRYTGRTGETFTAENYTERKVSMTVGTTVGVDLEFTQRELMLELDQISERVVKPAAESLASILDTTYLLAAINNTANQVGTAGTIVSAMRTYNLARAKMSWESAPNSGATLLIDPDMHVEAVDSGKSYFNPTAELTKQFMTGLVGNHAGAKVYEVQNLPIHTNGQRGGSPVTNGVQVDGAGARTSSLVTDGWTAAAASRVKAGDVFTIATVYAVNPWTRQSTGALRKFTVISDASSDGSGNATLTISPGLTASGPFQNVSNLPADGSALTFDGNGSATYPVGLRFHKDAFLFGTLSQPHVSSKEFCKVVTDESTGITIRYIRDWDTEANKQIDRFDVVPAWGVAFTEFACRIASGPPA